MRKRDGKEFPPNTLYHIVSGIMRYLRENKDSTIDFFSDAKFALFKSSLNSELKRLQALGLGSQKCQAEPLTMTEEEILWEKGCLGDSNTKTLLNTIIFCNGLYFAL